MSNDPISRGTDRCAPPFYGGGGRGKGGSDTCNARSGEDDATSRRSKLISYITSHGESRRASRSITIRDPSRCDRGTRRLQISFARTAPRLPLDSYNSEVVAGARNRHARHNQPRFFFSRTLSRSSSNRRNGARSQMSAGYVRRRSRDVRRQLKQRERGGGTGGEGRRWVPVLPSAVDRGGRPSSSPPSHLATRRVASSDVSELSDASLSLSLAPARHRRAHVSRLASVAARDCADCTHTWRVGRQDIESTDVAMTSGIGVAGADKMPKFPPPPAISDARVALASRDVT